jgi:thiol-disulfide isomerase/thioredoxin
MTRLWPSSAVGQSSARRRSPAEHVGAVVIAMALAASGCSATSPDSLGSPAPTPGAPTAVPGNDTGLLATQAASSQCDDSVDAMSADGAVNGGLPPIALPCLDGSGETSLSSLRGPLVLTIWASWCVPCRRELPAFAAVHERAVEAGDPVRIVGLNWLDDSVSAVQFAQEIGVTFPSFFDADGIVRGPLRINAQPATLFVDATGRVVHVERGPIYEVDDLTALIDRHLGVQVPA